MNILIHHRNRLALSTLLIGAYTLLFIWMGANMVENTMLWGSILLFTFLIGTPIMAYLLGLVWHYNILPSTNE